MSRSLAKQALHSGAHAFTVETEVRRLSSSILRQRTRGQSSIHERDAFVHLLTYRMSGVRAMLYELRIDGSLHVRYSGTLPSDRKSKSEHSLAPGTVSLNLSLIHI